MRALPNTHVVRQQEAHRVYAKRHDQRHELVGARSHGDAAE
jgi:hypothetical protein